MSRTRAVTHRHERKCKLSVATKPTMRWQHVPVWLLYRFFVLVLSILPLSAARTVLAGFFSLLGPLSASANARMERSLKVAFPAESADWRAERRKRTWVNLGRSVAESIKSRAVQNQLSSTVTERVEPELSASLQDPRGQLLLMGHTGAWEVAIQMAPRLGKPVMGVFRPLENSLIERDLQRSRQAAGIEMVSIADPSMIRRALRHLKRGGSLALFVDQRWADGEPLALFGQPALTTLSPGLLQRSTNARVSTLFCRRQSREHSEVVMESLAFEARDDDDWRQRGQAIMQAFNGRLEDWTKAYPDDWFWLQDRWKP